MAALKLEVVSKLRHDANLRYRLERVQTRDRRRRYDGKVDLNTLDLLELGRSSTTRR